MGSEILFSATLTIATHRGRIRVTALPHFAMIVVCWLAADPDCVHLSLSVSRPQRDTNDIRCPSSSGNALECLPTRAVEDYQSQVLSIMASDDAYGAFLDQANQDTGSSKASSKTTSAPTKAVDTAVPELLHKVRQYYVSDSDEPFEPVSLKWSGKNMPSESELPV